MVASFAFQAAIVAMKAYRVLLQNTLANGALAGRTRLVSLSNWATAVGEGNYLYPIDG